MAVQLLLCGVLPPGLVQYCLQHSRVVAVKLFLQLFCQRPCNASGGCPILFKVLTLNVALCIVCLHFSNFCCLNSVADVF